MATWPDANKKRLPVRNATLELLTDRRDGDSKSRQSSQSSNRDSAFENLALSVERDVQPLNGVSSFHNDLLCSEQNDRLQVSVASGSSSAETHRSGSSVTFGCISIFVTFLLLVSGIVLVANDKKSVKTVKIACELVRAAGLFGFTGGVTNWLGIKLIFNRIPGVFFSGAITKNFMITKKLMANFILESFFSPSQVKKYIGEKTRMYLTADSIDDQLEKLLNSASTESMINEQLDVFMGTPQGLRLSMLGITKAKLKPLMKLHLMSIKTSIVPLLLSCIESVEILNADHLREQIVDLISTRTHELSAQQVKHLVKDAVYRHLNWIVFWGSVLGAIVGCLAELASVYAKGP